MAIIVIRLCVLFNVHALICRFPWQSLLPGFLFSVRYVPLHSGYHSSRCYWIVSCLCCMCCYTHVFTFHSQQHQSQIWRSPKIAQNLYCATSLQIFCLPSHNSCTVQWLIVCKGHLSDSTLLWSSQSLAEETFKLFVLLALCPCCHRHLVLSLSSHHRSCLVIVVIVIVSGKFINKMLW